MSEEQPKEQEWAVEVDEYKANPRRYEMRDGLNKARLELELSKKLKGTGIDDLEELYLINNYPLILYGIGEAEGFDVPLSEEDFWKLPEVFVLQVSEAIREVNPQYGVPFAVLQRRIEEASQSMLIPPSTSTEKSEPDDKTT